MRTLSRRELNRALLTRQGLLERHEPPLPRALERIGGIQAQYAPSMYIGLWSRVAGFERGALTGALEQRTVVQATLMRVTIHLVSREDFWPFALATRASRRTLWLRAARDPLSPAAMAGAARALRRRLAGGGELPRKEIEALLGKPRAAGVGLWVDLVRAPPSGTWERRRADRFAAAEDWIGAPRTTVTAGTEHLVLRYLAGFGPASRTDVASFTGLPLTALRPVLARLELCRFRGEDGDELLDVPDGPLPDPETPAPPRFLPTWDATLLVHARRTLILPEAYRPLIFHTKMPPSYPTFLVDGQVTGMWRFEEGGIGLTPFRRLLSGERREVDEEAARLAEFHSG